MPHTAKRRLIVSLAILALSMPTTGAEPSPCDSPGAVMNVDLAADVAASASATLNWESASGASVYDVYLGPTDPPPVYAEDIEGTTLAVAGLAAGTKYYWYVIAHAECDPTLTSRTETSTFDTSGSCESVGAFSLVAPLDGATGISTLASFQWSAAPGAASYDLYLGREPSPALIASGITGTSVEIPRLLPATRYTWRIVARSACNASSTASSSVSSFTVTDKCPAPAATTITFVPSSNIVVGQTYAISWAESDGIDAGGGYVVERSTSQSFGSTIDRQETTSTSASFIPSTTGTIYHRVRAVAGCSSRSVSSWSTAEPVNVVKGAAHVIMTRPPTPVITQLGGLLEDERSSFTIENVGSQSVQVAVTGQEVDSVPFFRIYDPFGGDRLFVTLPPREPKTFELKFSGPPNNVENSYQGIIAVTPISPTGPVSYGWINLRVGGGTGVAPKFLVNGLESEYVFFPAKKGDDSDRPAISVDVLNSGSAGMKLAYEVGPELWLRPETGWNDTAIPANSFRPLRLRTSRFYAPNNSALPRYTYFKVRSSDGQSARLLVQDNTAFELGSDRASLSSISQRSFIVPTVRSEALAGGALRNTRIRLSNLGGDPVQTDLYYTPTGTDGYTGNILRATVVVPPNDVVNLTDPLVQLFALARPAVGSLEIRAAPEKIGVITVSTSTETRLVGGGTYHESIPTLIRGEGAVLGAKHAIAGLFRSAEIKPDLVLVETTGRDSASVKVQMFDSGGSARGSQTITVPRYGRMAIDDVVQALGGGSSGSGLRIDVETQSGGGAVAAIASFDAGDTRGAAARASVPITGVPAINTLGRTFESRRRAVERPGNDQSPVATPSDSLRVLSGNSGIYLVPFVAHGTAPMTGMSGTWRVELTLLNHGDESTAFRIVYSDLVSGKTSTASRNVAAGATAAIGNVVSDLFGIASSQASLGHILVQTTESGKVFATLHADRTDGTLNERIPVVSAFSESLTGDGSFKPIVIDGIEQSIDDSRGTRSNLILTEIEGNSASVLVRLYEAGNRSDPIAEKLVSIPAGKQVVLSDVFDALDLNGEDRSKDRVNVQCVVIPDSAFGLVSAMLETIDNRTGDVTLRLLEPAGGIPGTGVQKVTLEEPVIGRRRPVRRP